LANNGIDLGNLTLLPPELCPEIDVTLESPSESPIVTGDIEAGLGHLSSWLKLRLSVA
jgi:hypothetical protein